MGLNFFVLFDDAIFDLLEYFVVVLDDLFELVLQLLLDELMKKLSDFID